MGGSLEKVSSLIMRFRTAALLLLIIINTVAGGLCRPAGGHWDPLACHCFLLQLIRSSSGGVNTADSYTRVGTERGDGHGVGVPCLIYIRTIDSQQGRESSAD